MFIKDTKSLCPECLDVLPATVFARNGQVFITKTCKIHGEYSDIYWSDYEQYIRAEKYEHSGVVMKNPRTEEKKGCPYDCGICPNHKSTTMLGIIDVTNRCNLRCPICFAHAGAAGYLYEPTKQQIEKMLKNLRSNNPVRTPSLQFSGGEPTVREDLPELITMAKELGFPYVMVDSNGIKMAESPEYCKELRKAGADSVYLQFDGVTPEPYIAARGFNLLPIKLRAIENLKKAGFNSIVLVPVLVKGVNDNQVGDILRFAIEHKDCVKGVNFQPVSFSGRIDKKQREKMRITIPELTKQMEIQTQGYIKQSDWFPIPTVEPLTRFISNMKQEEEVDFCSHVHCGMGTLLFIDGDKVKPITEDLDIDKVLAILQNVNENLEEGKIIRAKLEIVSGVVKIFKFKPLIKYLKDVILYNNYHDVNRIYHQRIFVGAMHFMDPYNFDLERLQHCVIHYAVPDGRIIPFCAMNTIHRNNIEKQFSKPLDVKQMSPLYNVEKLLDKILNEKELPINGETS
ncbi:radical SAM protein [Candidatus Bathyarchaeota archaeon]|nr:radical SAM protein [Candidatus Bathyarchaeota archaeon]MCK4702033.1 radical SAM protein [Candidatus Bathyarchaeota archaeon]